MDRFWPPSPRAAVGGVRGDGGRRGCLRAERRRDAGTVTTADVLSLQVHLAQMRQRAIEAAGQAAIARATLNRLRGAAVDAEFAVGEPPLVPPATARDWRPLALEALAARPDLRRRDAEVRVAASTGRHAKAAWWPQVAAQAAYQYDGLSFADRASAWVVGGEARWSFSTGMGDKAAMRAAAAADARARAELADARAAVEVEVIAAVRQLESAEAREGVARASVAQARESQRILRDRYDAGLVARAGRPGRRRGRPGGRVRAGVGGSRPVGRSGRPRSCDREEAVT